MYKLFTKNKWVFDIAPLAGPLFRLKCVLSVFSDFIVVFYPLVLGRMIDGLIYKRDMKIFLGYIFAYIFIFLLNQMVNIKIRRTDIKIKLKVTNRLKNFLFKRTLSLEAIHLSNSNTGDLVNIINTDVENIVKFYDQLIINTIRAFFYILTMSLILFIYSYQLALLILGLSFLTVYLMDLMDRRFRKLRTQYREDYGSFLGWLTEFLNGMQDIRINCAEDIISGHFNRQVEGLLEEGQALRYLELEADRLNGFFTSLYTLVFWFFSAAFIIAGKISLGIFYTIEKYFKDLVDQLNQIKEEKLKSHAYYASFDKINQLLSLSFEEEDHVEDGETYSIYGKSLNFKDVSFTYGDKNVLEDLNLKINQAELLAIVGANGEGKSSLLGLILKFYRPQAGAIEFDGLNIGQIPRDNLRQQIGYLQQTIVIFDGSLKDNLKMYKEGASNEEIWKVLDKCGLYGTVKSWPNGLDTNLKNGRMLSEGQKQRISFARILLKNPNIILLDEPTSNLDDEMELFVINELKNIFKGKIIIVVSHKLATTKIADRIGILEGGKFIDIGNNQDLMERSPTYRQLFLQNGVEDYEIL